MASTEQELTLDLPWPPSTNKIWRQCGRKTVLSAEAKKYRSNVQAVVGLRPQTIVGPVVVWVRLHPPRIDDSDVDNRQKALFDALQSSRLIKNDRQIRAFLAHWAGVKKDGRAIVTIRRVRVGEVVEFGKVEVF